MDDDKREEAEKALIAAVWAMLDAGVDDNTVSDTVAATIYEWNRATW